jgi:hypothetical protein
MNSFKVGDRVIASDDYHTGFTGTIVAADVSGGPGWLVRLDTPTEWCYFEEGTSRYFDTVSLKLQAASNIRKGTRLDQVLTHLLTGKSLTQGEGLVLGYGTRVAASVHELRRKGHNIVTTMKEDLNGFPYAEYRLVTRRANGNRKAA